MSRNLLPLYLMSSLVTKTTRATTTIATTTIAGAISAGAALADAPRVAADIAPVHSLVARVMDGVGEPALVIPAGASPHEYSLRPSEAGALQEADLVFWIGPDLTPWLDDAVKTLASDSKVTTLMEAEGTIALPIRESALFEAHSHDHGGHDHEGHGHDLAHDHDHDHDHKHDASHDHDHKHDEAHSEDHDHKHDDENAHDDHDHAGHDHAGHDHGHHHGEYDPHAWLSPENAATWLNVIAANLSAADPENAGAYFANAAAGREEIDALSEEINGLLEPVRGGKFIVFHDAYQYFEESFDIPASGAISLSDATDPSPARIAEIQGRVADEDISCVLAEPQFNPGMVTMVLDGSQANTAVLDPLGSSLEPGPALYPNLLRNLATTLADCL